MEVELKILNDIVKERVNKDGDLEEYLFKTNVITKLSIDIERVVFSQTIGPSGKVYRSRCTAIIEGVGQLLIKHKYEDMVKLKNSNKVIRGYGR